LALDKKDLTYAIGLNVADYFESQNDLPRAIDIYQNIFRKFPAEKVNTAQKMAKVLSKQKKYQETIDLFTGLLEADEQTANPLAYYVGVSYYTLENMDSADEYFQRALNAGYRDADVYLKQGEIKVRKGQWQAGLDLLNEGIKLGGVIFTPEANTYKYFGQAYAKLDDTKNAADNFRKAIAAGSKDADVYLQYAANASLNRDFQGVLEALEPRAQANDRNAEFQYYLGSAYDNLGMPQQAIQYYQKALEAGYTNSGIVRTRIAELRQNNEEAAEY
jgi:tetratricopeptide (TPR) repeat protein